MCLLPTQVLAYSLGLGTLVQDETKLRRHMKAELKYNDCPYGLLVMTGMNSHHNIAYFMALTVNINRELN